MPIDLDEAEAGRAFKGQVCVIGGGIAGLLIAMRLAGQGESVVLLEAGGLEFEERSQSLYDGEMAASVHTGTTEGRFRTFGGSSTRWGGQLLPYTKDIFEATGLSCAWPIRESDVAPYYEELQRMLGTDLLPFDATLLPALKRSPVKFGESITLRFSKWIPFAKRNLARTLGREALHHPLVTVVTHANCAELVTGDAGGVVAVRLVDYAGREFRCEADTFVVAGGTIESARLLLSSPGVPDPHGQMGLYFQDHVSAVVAEFAGVERERMLEQLGPFLTEGTLHTCKLEASVLLRERERLPAVMAHVTIEEPEDSGVAAVREFLRAVQRGNWVQAARKHAVSMLRGVADVLRLLFYSRFRQRRAVSARARVQLRIDMEQVANPENRIRLSDARDRLGLRKVVVDWRVGELERKTLAQFTPVIREELERLGMAPARWVEQPVFADTFHAMGGLRMGTDPRHSVVTPDLQVQGVENLYVASCAVYPSGGSSNPTFTLMALALRLADRLAQQGQNGPA